jgi:hypothetical protein
LRAPLKPCGLHAKTQSGTEGRDHAKTQRRKVGRSDGITRRRKVGRRDGITQRRKGAKWDEATGSRKDAKTQSGTKRQDHAKTQRRKVGRSDGITKRRKGVKWDEATGSRKVATGSFVIGGGRSCGWKPGIRKVRSDHLRQAECREISFKPDLRIRSWGSLDESVEMSWREIPRAFGVFAALREAKQRPLK